jgi:hypothetical protein
MEYQLDRAAEERLRGYLDALGGMPTDSGANWKPRDASRNWSSVASSADGTKLGATANGGCIYTSTSSGPVP